jgi:hypothetical protein
VPHLWKHISQALNTLRSPSDSWAALSAAIACRISERPPSAAPAAAAPEIFMKFRRDMEGLILDAIIFLLCFPECKRQFALELAN